MKKEVKNEEDFLKGCYKYTVFAHGACKIQKSPYLCTVFFIKLIQIDISSSYVLLRFAYATPYLLPLYRLGVGKE